MKKVILEFQTQEQAENFFSLFDDTYYEDCQKDNRISKLRDTIAEHIGTESINIIKNKNNYLITVY